MRGSWRARIGLVNPSRGDVLLYEYYRAAPAGVIVVPAALNLKRLDSAELDRVVDSYVDAVRAVFGCGPDAERHNRAMSRSGQLQFELGLLLVIAFILGRMFGW